MTFIYFLIYVQCSINLVQFVRTLNRNSVRHISVRAEKHDQACHEIAFDRKLKWRWF